MKAFQLVEHGAPGRFELRDVPDPKPAPDEVVVEVRACGLNHLDLWLEEADLPIKVDLPRTPGGEVAGVVNQQDDGSRPAKPCSRRKMATGFGTWNPPCKQTSSSNTAQNNHQCDTRVVGLINRLSLK